MTYRVLYENNITDSMWTPLTTVAGDGTAKTVSDLLGPGTRFSSVGTMY
jgi:hypothetical protein